MKLTTLRRWAPWFALVVLFSIATSLLSWWQFSRREERVAKNNLISQNYEAAPIGIDQVNWVIDEKTSMAILEWQPVTLTGKYLPEQTLLVRNRPLNGNPGFIQLTPFQLTTGEVMVIDRGWLPAGNDITKPQFNPIPDSATKTLVVRLRASEPNLGKEPVAGQLASIDIASVAKLNPKLDFETRFYGRLASEEPSSGELPLAMPKPSLDEGNHLSYALQWLLFGIMAIAALIWAIQNDRRVRLEEQGKLAPKEKKLTQADFDAAFEDQNQ